MNFCILVLLNGIKWWEHFYFLRHEKGEREEQKQECEISKFWATLGLFTECMGGATGISAKKKKC